MVRFVRTADGMLAEGRTLSGRGAWLCRGSAACLDMAVRRKAFGRALRGEIKSEAIERLRESTAVRDSRAVRVSMDGYDRARRKG